MANHLIKTFYYVLFCCLGVIGFIGMSLSQLISGNDYLTTLFFKILTVLFSVAFIYAFYPISEKIWKERILHQSRIVIHFIVASLLFLSFFSISWLIKKSHLEKNLQNSFGQCEQVFSGFSSFSLIQNGIHFFTQFAKPEWVYRLTRAEEECRMVQIKKILLNKKTDEKAFSFCQNSNLFDCYVALIKKVQDNSPLSSEGIILQQRFAETLLIQDLTPQLNQIGPIQLIEKNIQLGKHYLWSYQQIENNSFLNKIFPESKKNKLSDDLTQTLKNKHLKFKNREIDKSRLEMQLIQKKLSELIGLSEKILALDEASTPIEKEHVNLLKKQLASLKFSLDNLI